jgi:hypothetical protein
MNGASARELSLWIAAATLSFPVPLSPVINTEAEVGATRWMSEKTSRIGADVPTKSARSPW